MNQLTKYIVDSILLEDKCSCGSSCCTDKNIDEIKVHRPAKYWNFNEHIPNFDADDITAGDIIVKGMKRNKVKSVRKDFEGSKFFLLNEDEEEGIGYGYYEEDLVTTNTINEPLDYKQHS